MAFRSCFATSLAQDGLKMGPTWLKLGQHSHNKRYSHYRRNELPIQEILSKWELILHDTTSTTARAVVSREAAIAREPGDLGRLSKPSPFQGAYTGISSCSMCCSMNHPSKIFKETSTFSVWAKQSFSQSFGKPLPFISVNPKIFTKTDSVRNGSGMSEGNVASKSFRPNCD